MANSEAKNVGYEAHPMFKVYQNNTFMVFRCQHCGGEDLYLKDGIPPDILMCNDCGIETAEDDCSFVEWCEHYGYNPDRLDTIEIFEDTEKRYLYQLVGDFNSESGKLVIVGVDSKENI